MPKNKVDMQRKIKIMKTNTTNPETTTAQFARRGEPFKTDNVGMAILEGMWRRRKYPYENSYYIQVNASTAIHTCISADKFLPRFKSLIRHGVIERGVDGWKNMFRIDPNYEKRIEAALKKWRAYNKAEKQLQHEECMRAVTWLHGT